MKKTMTTNKTQLARRMRALEDGQERLQEITTQQKQAARRTIEELKTRQTFDRMVAEARLNEVLTREERHQHENERQQLPEQERPDSWDRD